MDNIKLRFLCKSDIPLLCEILEDDGMEFNPKQLEKFLSEKQNLAFVAIVNGKIIGLAYGYALMRPDKDKPQFLIYSVNIHSNYQDRGYGSKLIQFIVDYARENNYCESFVITENDNERACRIYEKAGMNHSSKDNDRVYVIEY
jgi:ribosomal protein S18 acetylase RimI-like enzyme